MRFKLVCMSAVAIISMGMVGIALSEQSESNLAELGVDMETIRASAEQGDATAQFSLGLFNLAGEEQTAAESVRWFRLAAEQGHPMAQMYLGLAYSRGDGVQRDAAEAMRWYRLAAESGGKMPFVVVLAYIDDALDGVAEGAEVASWIRAGAEQGNGWAQLGLGVLYDPERRVLQDAGEAVRWIRLAAESDSSAVLGAVTLYSEDMLGTLVEGREMVSWIRTGAEQGNVFSQGALVVLYSESSSVSRDLVLARMWASVVTTRVLAGEVPPEVLAMAEVAEAYGTDIEMDMEEEIARLEEEMTRDEIDRATELARACLASNYLECGR